MKLAKMIVESYRQFDKVELNFDDNVTILAGANNSGKTSLITLIKNITDEKKSTYSEADIPAKNMKEWVEQVYPMFEEFFRTGKSVEELESELVNNIVSDDSAKESILIKTTKIYMQVDYNTSRDDIKLFADYIMDLDEKKNSFYFLYSFEINKNQFKRNLIDNFEKIQKRFSDLREPNLESKERYLKQLIVKIYIKSIIPICYFCDSTYQNKCAMDDVKEFRKLFNFTYIKASRPLDDDDTDHEHTLNKEMIKMVKLDDDWNDLIQVLPDELLKPIQDHQIDKRVQKASLNSLKDTIDALERTNGGKPSKLMLDMNVSEEDISELLQRITTTVYDVDGFYLGESSQGLGYSNLIYMHLQLDAYEKKKNELQVNVFFIEEPESHMHPQMQQVFIRYLLDYYKKENIQGVVTTHSNEMVRVAGISHIRVIRKAGRFKSELYDLSVLKNEVKEEMSDDDSASKEALINFFDWFFAIGYSEIVFADKAIMYEGDTERLLVKSLLTLPKYEKLNQQYIAFIQVGGAYAYNYKKLIELLKIKTLILTDIDYDKDAITQVKIEESHITNATIKNFYEDESEKQNPTVKDLYEWKKNKKNILDNNLIYLGFQDAEDNYARTLEEAMLGNYFNVNIECKFKRSEWIQKKEDSALKFSIPNNKKGEINTEISLRDILKSTSGGKTDFMYSVILNRLTSCMEPNYIREGLEWLMEQ